MRVRVTTKGGRKYRTSEHEAGRLVEATVPESAKQAKPAKKKEKKDANQEP